MVAVAYQPEGYDDALEVNTTQAVAFVNVQRERPVAPSSLPPLSKQTIRTLLVVDGACDIPRSWLEYHAVAVMPRLIRYNNETLLDNNTATQQSLAQRVAERYDYRSRSIAQSAHDMRDQMQRYMLSGTQAVLHVCSSAKRSQHFVNALSATQSLVAIHNKVRRTLGQESAVTAWVIDSMNALGGVGVMLAHAVTLRESGMLAANMAVTLNSFRSNVHTLIVPHHLGIASHTSRVMEHASVPSWKLTAASMLGLHPVVHLNADHANVIRNVRGADAAINGVFTQIEKLVTAAALNTPFISISYAGRLDEIERMPTFIALRSACSRHQVLLSLANMSATGVVALGARAISISFASQQFKP